jgi:hypothetical protein
MVQSVQNCQSGVPTTCSHRFQTVEAFFEALKKLVAEMKKEERRAAREGLTEEELVVFNLLTLSSYTTISTFTHTIRFALNELSGALRRKGGRGVGLRLQLHSTETTGAALH